MIKKRTKILFFILLMNTVLFSANKKIITINEIKPGMTGYGLTVFKGIKVEKFDVEVISVIKKNRPRSGLILAKVNHKVIDKAGIIAGMSGSPIYINNKLAGALAFSWGFSKEPIAMITPIEDMLNIFTLQATNHSFNFEPDYFKTYLNNNDKSSVKLVKTPLIFHDGSQELINIFKSDLKSMNFLPMHGSSDGTSYEVPDKFEPGSAVGVNLITGDLNLAGIGTVTYVDKNRLLIFGHPMFYSGQTDMPLSHAYIHTVIPSLLVSFKLGSATKIAGRIYQDQLAGLAGNLNERSKMIPVNIKLNYFQKEDAFNYNIIRSYHFLPRFLILTVFRSLEMMGGWLEKNTLKFSMNIHFNDKKVIKIKNTFASLQLAQSMKDSMMYLLNPLNHLMINKFKDINIKKIDIKLDINKKVNIAEILNIKAIKKVYEPGEILKLKVKLKPYKGKIFYKTISIKLPYNIKQKKITLFVTSDQERQYIDYILSPYKYRPYDFEQLIELYNELAQATDMAIWTFVKDKSIITKGHSLENLPASYYSILQNSLESGTHKSIVQIKNKIPGKYIIIGAGYMTLEINKKLDK